MAALCRNMRVSVSGFYSWLNREPSSREKENRELRKLIEHDFTRSKGTYGRRRIAAKLNKEREKNVSINRVERRMKELNVAGYQPKSFKKTTVPDPILEDSPNLVKDATTRGINEIWVSDLTYIATKEGWLYLCVILDLHSRKVVGWCTRSDMTAKIVIEAFDRACAGRKPESEVIFHSDKGGQYKSKKFRRRLKRRGFKQSMTGADHCFDNAHAESFFGTLKKDMIRGVKFESRNQAETAIFEYIEATYNRLRLHSSLAYQSPEEFEENIA